MSCPLYKIHLPVFFIMLVSCIAAAFYLADSNLLQTRNHLVYYTDSNLNKIEVAKARTMPFSERLPTKQEKFYWYFEIIHNPSDNTKIHLSANECITKLYVNGKPYKLPVTLSLCKMERGIAVDLAAFLHEGNNKVIVEGWARDGRFDIFYSPLSTISDSIGAEQLIIVILLLPFIYLWWAIFLPNGTSLRLPVTVIYLSAVAFYIFRYLLALPNSNLHDYYGHYFYIEHILYNFSLPSLSCWECYQPPAFYIFSTIAVGIGNMLGQVNMYNSIKLFSFIIYLIFCGVSFTLIKRLNLTQWLTALCFALFMFWPLAPIKAADINNDISAATAILLSFLFMLKWYDIPRWQNFAAALAVAAAGMFIKSTCMVSFPIIGAITLLAIFEKRLSIKKLFRAEYIIPFITAVCVGSIWLAHLQYGIKDNRSALVYNTVKGFSGLWIEKDKLSYYISFPLKNYIYPPFFFDFQSEKYFWPTFLKTALHGEWWWKAKVAASYSNILLLLMIIYIAAARPKIRAHLIALASLIIMLLAFRISQPALCNQDIRYIYAAIPLFCMIYVRSIQNFLEKRQYWFAYAGIAIAAQMIICSVIIILTEYISN